ncbi:methionyl-tRNA formyltransferase [Candidatus Poribacteria bacterium]|jgi:methionyl-tRNA formyltransferase|nr:methionyl-tRNA formyltransferase [Candidatus Poribacteria bacterium]MBT5532237.1 methionyl-tRNA formyltransferase [Candidatus Poribacteria bacterium]MBT7100913.1 methionyl-tRNA formyltransferase [Candidatus Poribacteria bacterium]MBT7807646.1 methionyl-tRNA formyltransferase [Candidatus Poribacteria bacterium]
MPDADSRPRVVFMGTPEFAVPALRLLATSVELAAVVTQPDRPSGRGRKLTPSPVKVEAEALGLPIHQPERARAREFVRVLSELAPDVIAIVAYGQILPRSILDIPPHGCLNIHPSLLPTYRGAAPVQWALWNGDEQTGVTVMQIDEGEDTGPIVRQEATAIEPTETAPELMARLAETGAEMLSDVILHLPREGIATTPQDDSTATHAPKFTREMGVVDWTLPSGAIHNRYRACVPWPGAQAFLPGGVALRVKSCAPTDRDVAPNPGAIVVEGGRMFAQTGQGSLELLRVQPENRAEMDVPGYLNGLRGDVPAAFELG